MSMRIATFLLIALLGAQAGHAQVSASLVAADSSIKPGTSFTVAVRLVHQPGWHTYWINPGVGQATSLKWRLPEGLTAGEIEWPAPSIIATGGSITGHGYTADTLLPVKIAAAASLPTGSSASLAVRAKWLMCSEERCIPGGADLSVTLPVSAEPPAPDPTWSAEIARVMTELPRTLPEWSASAKADGDVVTLTLARAKGAQQRTQEGVHFFSGDAYIAHDAAQSVRWDGARYVLTLRVGEDAPSPPPSRLVGVLIADSGWQEDGSVRALNIDASLSGSDRGSSLGTAGGSNGQPSSSSARSGTGFASLLAMAFLGGLILNLMPCVFPVLGIKILGFIHEAGSDRRRIALHGLSYTLGVLVSFWVLAAALAMLRAGGHELGWGFQLQSPQFVFVLAVVMLLFALSLSGVFEFGLRASGVGAGLQMKRGQAGSFLAGVLATIVATPCSAPLLAPALGAALSVPTAQSFVLFTCIALGVAAPYLLLSLRPQLMRFMPRPGRWMETFRQLMGFPLYATAAFLIWVLAAQTAEAGLLLALLGMTVIALAAWLYGRWHEPASVTRRLMFTRAGALALLIAGISVGWPRAPTSTGVTWEPWSGERVEQLRAEGRPIYVDFTARWCATCQANKTVVFASSEVQRLFQEKSVAALRADWTNADPRITAELARWNRSAVPFNLVYLPGQEPRVLPEILTASLVMDALAQR